MMISAKMQSTSVVALKFVGQFANRDQNSNRFLRVSLIKIAVTKWDIPPRSQRRFDCVKYRRFCGISSPKKANHATIHMPVEMANTPEVVDFNMPDEHGPSSHLQFGSFQH